MELYRYLKETLLLEDLKKNLMPNLHKIQDLIFEYCTYKDVEILDELVPYLDKVVTIFDNLGYDYEPANIQDEDEPIFRNILIKYRESISSFITNFSEDKFREFNSHTRQVSNLIEQHRLGKQFD